jgi:16S rRNA processing protein RimM
MEQSTSCYKLNNKDWVAVGKVLRSYGTNSKFHLKSYTRPADNIFDYIKKLYICLDGISLQKLDVTNIKLHGKNFLATLSRALQKEEIDMMYRGKLLYIKSLDLPKLEPNEYYWKDLIGLKALDSNNNEIGIVASIIEAGAHDVLMIEKDGKHIDAIPFKIGEYIKEKND